MSDDAENIVDTESANGDQNPKIVKPSSRPSKKKSKPKKATKKPATNKLQNAKRSFSGPRPFPADTLENAVRVPKVIKELNGGNAWPPSEIANALEMKMGTNPFYYITAAARDYGLTAGSRETEQIALNPLGRELVYATSPESERDAIKRAFFNVELFQKVYEYYKGGTLPELKWLQNTLETVFSIQPKFHEEFFRVYTANCKYLEQYGISAADSAVESDGYSRADL